MGGSSECQDMKVKSVGITAAGSGASRSTKPFLVAVQPETTAYCRERSDRREKRRLDQDQVGDRDTCSVDEHLQCGSPTLDTLSVEKERDESTFSAFSAIFEVID